MLERMEAVDAFLPLFKQLFKPLIFLRSHGLDKLVVLRKCFFIFGAFFRLHAGHEVSHFWLEDKCDGGQLSYQIFVI